MTKDSLQTTDADGGDLTPPGFSNPGMEPHRPRLSDTSPRGAKRAERQVVFIFTISILATIGGIVGYFAFPLDGVKLFNVRMSTLSIGAGLGIGMLGIGIGAIHWAKSLMDDREKSEPRHPMVSDKPTRAEALEMLREGISESKIARRPLLKGALGTAVAIAPLTFLVPLIGNLGGDWDVEKFKRTAWRPVENGNPEHYHEGKYRYITVDPSNRKLKASDITNGNIVHVLPAGLHDDPDFLTEKAKAAVILVRVDPEIITPLPGREDWTYEGIIAYSKICTHVGCPVALYERTTHHLLCPCHQSTFDVTDHAKVVFGPAKRALPQLPIAVDDEGYLYAMDDFDEAVGPSFWERER
ncbi:ubiquinol-cytochrome c reductase iron-sulfur subunit [Pseudactinotalea sp. HY158]|uniref:cytochrome bc1 complex Rieske iron-sulfur subunit n=1 Tax=Pseudactinotalea sp. HY158 TaxID=2654547 RepID=UPI00129CD21A|nr:Rieske 2Fe-2S domain-containing protein [Pseudactinotalea sp. HY158]QGH69260.1 Rieske 2Fe-2S domain-containing protein [Pseudactinotalea sp. HY158]